MSKIKKMTDLMIQGREKKSLTIHDIKPGTVITLVYGPGESSKPEFASHKGIAYGIKKGRFGDSLRVKMEDFTFEYVTSFTTVGIGAYAWPTTEKKSPASTGLPYTNPQTAKKGGPLSKL